MKIQYFSNVIMAICLGCAGALTALAQPVITTPPVSQTVLAGANVTFTVAVSGPGSFTHQWRLNGTNLPDIITTVAGNGTNGYSGDRGAATSAKLNSPQGVAVDGLGNLFIADQNNARIRKVNTNGIITTVAGNGTLGFSGDGGAATNARLSTPDGVAVDNLGNLYISDGGNDSNGQIRKVGTNGIITTLAGNGTKGYSGDGGAATNAQLNAAQAVGVDVLGNLYISDFGNNRIRKVDTNGIITTLAGTGTAGYSGDGGPATNALISGPSALIVDSGGTVFFADSGNVCIRKVDPRASLPGWLE